MHHTRVLVLATAIVCVLHQVHSFQERIATSKLHSWHLSQQQDSSTRKFTCFGRASQATPKGPHFRGHLKYIGAGDLRDNALVGRSQSCNAFYHQNCMAGVGQSPNQVAYQLSQLYKHPGKEIAPLWPYASEPPCPGLQQSFHHLVN